MRCWVRGVRITCSPRSRSAVSVYCSTATVSFPRRTTNAPDWAARAAGESTPRATQRGRLRIIAHFLVKGIETRRGRTGSAVGPSCAWSRDANRLDFVVLRNLQDDVHPLRDLPKDGVDPVEVRLGRVADEELAPARVLAGVGHGERPRRVLVDVLLRLALDRIAGAARADPSPAPLGIGVAPLDHEVRDHPVEPGPVIEACVR